MRHIYSEEEFLKKAIEYNEETTLEMVPKWCNNIAHNMGICREAKDIAKFPTMGQSKRVVLIGAGWSLKDEDIKELAKAKGCDVIVCNKSFERVVKNGLEPSWVVLLDADAISATQFEFLKNPLSGKVTPDFLVSSCSYPRTLKIINSYSSSYGGMYIFNPETDLGGQIPLNKTWEWMNYKPTFKHGGNVGGVMVDLAIYLNYQEIALLGFDFCEKPNPKWTMEEALEREYLYYPDQDVFVSQPFNFACYAQYVLGRMRAFSTVEGRKGINLADSPIMRHCPYLEQRNIHEFAESV